MGFDQKLGWHVSMLNRPHFFQTSISPWVSIKGLAASHLNVGQCGQLIPEETPPLGVKRLSLVGS